MIRKRQSRTAQHDLATHSGSLGAVSGVHVLLLVAWDDTLRQHLGSYGQATFVLGARPRRISKMTNANAIPSCTSQTDYLALINLKLTCRRRMENQDDRSRHLHAFRVDLCKLRWCSIRRCRFREHDNTQFSLSHVTWSQRKNWWRKRAIPYFLENSVYTSQVNIGGRSRRLPMTGQPGGPGG